MAIKYQKILSYLVLGAFLYMPLFGHLDTLTIRLWDESRVANNAYEMFKNHQYLVTFYDGQPDMWNTKPPLLIWFQVATMHIFGVSVLAIRLPSAIAALLTCIALVYFTTKYFKNYWLGFISVIVLCTSFGYINIHGTRTGDYDAMLTFFTTISSLCFFIYCETKLIKHLYLFFVFTALAVLTKSISGLLFLPAIFIYCITQKQSIPLLKNKHFYFGVILFLTMVLSYYLGRETLNPGYIEAVYDNELGGRYLKAIEEHSGKFGYYWSNFIHFNLTEWLIFIPIGVLFGAFIRNSQINRLTLFCSLLIITFFLIISKAETKLNWYDLPLYPFLAIIIAIPIQIIFNTLKESASFSPPYLKMILPYFFLLSIFYLPYKNILSKTYLPKESKSDFEFYELSYYLKDALSGKYNVNHQKVIYDGYNAHNLFFIRALNEKGIQIKFSDWNKLVANDIVFAQQSGIIDKVEYNYNYQIIQKIGNIKTYKILGWK